MKSYSDLNSVHKNAIDSFTKTRVKQMVASVRNPPKNILEVGGSLGEGAIVYHERFPGTELVGIDVEDWRKPENKSLYSAFHIASMSKLPFDDETFAVVSAGEVLEHLYPHDVDLALCEVFRVLVTGGIFVMTTPNPGSGSFLLKHRTVLLRAHKTQHFPASLKLRLRAIGFRKVKLGGAGRVAEIIGQHFPLRLYSSFKVSAEKI